jgi:hypothetical protein
MVFASSLISRLSPAGGAARLTRSHPVVTGAAGALVAVVVWLALAATAARADVATYQYSSGYQYFVVPTGVTSVHFDVVGGAGGVGQGSYGGGTAGPGGAVIGDLPVTPGQTLTLWAGGGGQSDGGAGYGSPGHNDFGGGAGGIATGGGFGAGNGAGGGAASYILVNGTPVAVAGGGGGGGGSGTYQAATNTAGGGASGGGYYASTKIPGSSSYGDTNEGGDAGTLSVLGGYPDYTDSDNGSSGQPGDTGSFGGGGGGGGGGYYVCQVLSAYICFAAGEGGYGGFDSWGGGGGAGGNSYADPSATNISYGRGTDTPSAAGQITLSFGAPSTGTLTASTATSYPGQSVTFHAFVDPTDGGGTVSFTNDGAAISGCSNLPFTSGGGTDWGVSCTTTSLTNGTHTITALYSGDQTYAGSTASTTESVYQSATSTSLTASPSSTTVGTAVTLTANVYSSDGGGTLSITRNGSAFPECRALALVSVSGHYQATCTLAWSVPGSYTLQAEYSGDAPYGASSASTTITVAAVAPTVTSISPKAGPTAGGGSDVQINGTNLYGTSKVMFGTTEAYVDLVSGSVILAEIPAHAAGAVDVTVTTPSGTSATTSADRYTYDAAPTVSSIAPASGGQGTVVTVNGTGFVSGTNAKFGSRAATKTTVVSATQLKATVPAGSGTVDVTVTNPGGTSATSASDQFTYIVPSVSSVSPNAGPIAGGQTVTIHGTNLTGATGVAFGTAAASNLTVVSDTELTATAPAHAAGVADVTVTTAKGTSAVVSADHYTYDAVPTVSAITPASGGQGTVVTITGTGFVAGYKVKFGSTAATKSTMVSATQLTATVPAGSGTVDTTVTTPGGTSATSASDQFAYLLPSVSSVAANAGPIAGGNTVTIHGTNLTGATGVTFGTAAASNVTVVSDTVLTATAPTHAAGMVDVAVTTPKGTSAVTAVDRYTYDPVPTVSNLSPYTAPAGTVITITGSGFVAGAKVMFGTAASTSVKLVSPTELQATAPASSASYAVVTVTTPGGTSDSTLSIANLFYYQNAS